MKLLLVIVTGGVPSVAVFLSQAQPGPATQVTWDSDRAFSPDGRTLATTAHHRPVQLWDISPLEMMGDK